MRNQKVIAAVVAVGAATAGAVVASTHSATAPAPKSQAPNAPAADVPAPTPPSPSNLGTSGASSWQEPASGFLGASSVWSADVARAPQSTSSAAEVSTLAQETARHYGGVAAFSLDHYSVNFITVGADVSRVSVAWDNCQGKSYTPKGLLGVGGQFASVPVPDDALPATGSDSTLSVYQPSTDTFWDFWKIHMAADGWHACWGGRIDKASLSYGYFLNGFGASASGLASEAGAIQISDVQRGEIDHAVALAITSPASWRDVSWPAQRSDGSSSSTSPIPEGTRFRLDPSVDVDTLALTPIGKLIARAAQKYGFIVTDKAGATSVFAESGALTQQRTGTNPWTSVLNGMPTYLVMKNFPWSRLQALPADYGKP